jgi:predicted MFS family arabinose efflux permease
MSTDQTNSPAVTAAIYAGCVIAFISFGFAATFGVFLRPMSEALGWSRETLSLSLAIQAICWGITQPLAGMVADRFGSGRVLAFGAVIASLGFALRGLVIDPTVFVLSGIIVGIGTGAAAFQIVIIALGKVVSPKRRSFILGLGTAAASAGMFIAAPASIYLMAQFGWQAAILVIAASYLLILPMAIFINRVSVPTVAAGKSQFGHAIKSAFQDRAYVLLFVGFFVCGFHVAFIQTHLPAYIADLGLAPSLGAWSLAIIGLFNVAGSFLSGWSGQRMSKKRVLSGIYITRAIVITLFILAPLTPGSVYVFSAAMGILWLSTVPLTTALVAQTQGIAYLSTLGGLVFLSHQSGAFIGAWLGGRIYDTYGDYGPMWWAAVILGVLAALIHLPIRETPGPLAQATT